LLGIVISKYLGVFSGRKSDYGTKLLNPKKKRDLLITFTKRAARIVCATVNMKVSKLYSKNLIFLTQDWK